METAQYATVGKICLKFNSPKVGLGKQNTPHASALHHK